MGIGRRSGGDYDLSDPVGSFVDVVRRVVLQPAAFFATLCSAPTLCGRGIWSHDHRDSLEGRYAPTLFTTSDTDFGERPFHALR